MPKHNILLDLLLFSFTDNLSLTIGQSELLLISIELPLKMGSGFWCTPSALCPYANPRS